MSDTTDNRDGLRDKYLVQRRDDSTGKHDACRYFVLDPQHDPIARDAIRAYATSAGAAGNWDLRADLHRWIDEVERDGGDQ